MIPVSINAISKFSKPTISFSIAEVMKNKNKEILSAISLVDILFNLVNEPQSKLKLVL